MQGNRTLPKHWLRTARKCTLLGALAGTAIWAAAPTPPSFTPSLWVNPLVGTAADGQTFPAAGVPFAMTQWTPQTRAGEAKCVAPYYYDSTRFQGFRGSHFLSGSCTQEYGSMTVMPMRDASHLDPQQWAENYTHATEHASPFLYTVDLPSSGIRAEVTGTERSGMMRFRFAAGTHVGFLGIEDNIRKATGVVHIDPARGEVTLTNPVTRIYQGNGKPAGFSAYYVLQFNQPFTIGGTYTARSPGDHATDSARRAHRHTGRRTQIGHNGPAGGYISFVLPADRTIILRVGTSFTSLQEARRNLAAEIPDFDFDHIVSRAREAWDSTLGRIVVDDDSPARITFYTALYHCLLLPRIFSDSDGSYPRFAGNGTIEHANGFTFYTDYSLWDTFRALHPLLTIVAPQRAGDMVRSLIAMGQQGGFLPIFPAWNSYTSEMVGDHADAVIADAFAKHLSGFDAEQAYKLMRRNATVTPDPALYKSGHGRRALADYERLGYIPLENKVRDAYHHREQVSRTLEYAYDDSLGAC
jgi:predicted alpha-1,2-mannosidase